MASPSVSADSPAAGAAFTLSATMRNDGDGDAAATTLRFYQSTDATITTEDTVVGTDAVGALAAQGTIAQLISLTAPSSPGAYYYGACVAAVTDESDTTNNCSSSIEVTVLITQQQIQGQPDLEVGMPTVSDDSPATGAPLTLSATVRNDGNGASPATTLRYYRSTDATITTADTAVGTDPVGALAAAGTIAQSISLTAPSSPGTYYYGACVEAVTDESDPTNNCSSAVTVTVTAPPPAPDRNTPDLVVLSPRVSNDSPAAETAFTFSATVRNAGSFRATRTSLRFYRSTNATISTADTAVGTAAVGALAAQGTSSESIALTAPSSPGTYYYGACVDAVTGESDTTNNCSSSIAVTVLITQQQQQGVPDLVVASPSVSDASPAAGAAFTLSVTVRNDGDGDAAATTLRYYQSPDATITTEDTVVGTDAVGALAAQETIAQSISLTAPSTPGPYYYGACVAVVTDESDTTNNCSSSIAVTVLITQQQQGVPDLVVASPSVSDDIPAAGAAFTLSVTVRNDGDGDAAATTLRYYQSTDATITTEDTVVGTDAVGALAAQGTIAESISLTAPSTPGAYYYGACVAAVTDESDTTNNCSSSIAVTVLITQQQQGVPDLVPVSLSITSNTPETEDSDYLFVTVTNTGDGESPATTLRFYRSPDATITTEDTVVGTDAVRALAAAGSLRRATPVTAPSRPGTYYYGACVAAVTDESDTTNNCSPAVTVTVRVAGPVPVPITFPAQTQPENIPWADVQLKVFVSATVAPGETFSMTLDMITGYVAIPATTLRLYRSADRTITRSDTAVGTVAMEALRQAWRRKSITLTAPGTTGEWYYGACVDGATSDPGSTVACSSGGGSAFLRVAIVGASDLIVSEIRYGVYQVIARVRNDGTGESFPTRIWFYRSSDAAISASNDKRLNSSSLVNVVQPNTTYDRELTHIFQHHTPPAEAGTYYYWACVAGARGETDTNNCSSSAVAVEHF